MRSIEPCIHSNTDRWGELIGQTISEGAEWSASLNMADWVNYLVCDILGDICFGKSFSMNDPTSELTYVPHLMADFVKLVHPIEFSPLASLWSPSAQEWEDFVEKCLSDLTRMEQLYTDTGKRKDLFHFLFGAVDPKWAQATSSTSYNKEVYPEPFRFNPERWIISEHGISAHPAQNVALAESVHHYGKNRAQF
ncbi:hypothetical protein PG994_011296 [Apiospora phragmitis]|uniref:Cytochrome P450 n=1 Tax=Apiospora phragmitis TaxID=2905665 RepID=A0ABR1TUM8_9PEZI